MSCKDESNKPTYIPPGTSIVDKQFNFHIVNKGVWRSSQPNKESLIRMKNFGLKTIVNLRGDSTTDVWESKIADSLMLHYFNIPLDAGKKQSDKKLNEILSIVLNHSNQPVLIHCLGGKDRTGMVVGIYELISKMKSLNEVHKEMLMYGYDEEKYPLIYQTVKNWENFKK